MRAWRGATCRLRGIPTLGWRPLVVMALLTPALAARRLLVTASSTAVIFVRRHYDLSRGSFVG